jgi:hypothetical protein
MVVQADAYRHKEGGDMFRPCGHTGTVFRHMWPRDREMLEGYIASTE